MHYVYTVPKIFYINEILIMVNTNTIFINGFSIGVNEADQIVVLGLTDGIVTDNETTYHFALPRTVFKNFLDNLTSISEELDLEAIAVDRGNSEE